MEVPESATFFKEPERPLVAVNRLPTLLSDTQFHPLVRTLNNNVPLFYVACYEEQFGTFESLHNLWCRSRENDFSGVNFLGSFP